MAVAHFATATQRFRNSISSRSSRLRLLGVGLSELGTWFVQLALRRHRRGLFALAVVLMLLVLIPLRASAAVTVSSFTATVQGNQVVIAWTTVNEINNAGFYLLRSTSPSGTFTKVPVTGPGVNPSTGLIFSKNPGGLSTTNYSYTDTPPVVAGQTYYYKLETVDMNGSTEQFGPVPNPAPSPTAPPPTPVPPTATTAPPAPARTATAIPAAISTPAPATATAIVAASSTPAPNSTPTRAATVRAAPPARSASAAVVKTATSIPDTSTPTPAPTLIALNASVPTVASTDNSASDPTTGSQPQDNTTNRSYYIDRLLGTGVLLTSGLMLFGAFALGAAAFAMFVRAVRR